MDKERTAGIEAFSRIAPAIPTIADVITCFNLFDVLTTSTGGRLTFAVYEKYLGALDRYLCIKKGIWFVNICVLLVIFLVGVQL